MKVMFIPFLLCLLFIQPARALDFSDIVLPGWKKEELAHDHLRFSNPSKPDTVIHLQVESYDPKNHWNPKTLYQDVKQMEKMRNTMSFALTLKDYKITAWSFAGNILDLEGSYLRLGNKPVTFKEMNFYHREHFIQFKLISDSKLLSKEEMKSLIEAIKPDQVDID